MISGTVANVAEKLQFSLRKNQLPVILQSEAAECGLACLTMVAGYYGYKTDLIEMRQRINLSLGGATLLDIMRFAESMQLSARPLRIELEDLENLQKPCILHWNTNHFVVLKSATPKSVVVHDPAKGEKRLTMAEASKCFTGVALELTPVKGFETRVQKPRLKFSDFWSRITGLKNSLLLIFTLSVMLQGFMLAGPYYVQLVIDDIILTADTSFLLVLAAGFFLLLLFEICTEALRGLSVLHFSNQMNVQLGANLFHHLIRLPMRYFETRHMGDIVSRFGSIQQIRQLLTTGLVETAIDGIMAIFTLLMIFIYSSSLSLVVLFFVSLYAIVRIMTYRTIRNISEQEIAARADENSSFMESVRGIQTIKIFGSESLREGQWQNKYVNAINQGIRLGNYNISFSAINRFLFGTENVIVVYLAALLVMDGLFSVGMLFAFMAYKRQFMSKVANLIEMLIEFKMLSLHFERISDIALTDKELLIGENRVIHNIKGNISVDNVTFSYSDVSEPVFKKLSLDISAGESVAIIGPSGCGKSTLMKVLLGLVEPEEGDVLVDGIPIKSFGFARYRQHIGVVMQNDELFSGTLADNIAFFDTNIDIEKVIDCAKKAAVHDDIMTMPMGYDSLIGDMGSTLSGGQKQRVILARALYRTPKILFMDEATSHLDKASESIINDSIRRLNVTRIIIAHREDTIATVNRVFNLGELVKKKNAAQ